VPERITAAKIGRQRARSAGSIRLTVPADLDFESATRFMAARMIPSIEMVTATGFERVVWLDFAATQTSARAVTIAVEYPRAACARLVARSAPELPSPWLRAAVARMFDLDADLNHFAETVRRDPILDGIVGPAPGRLRLLQLLDPFEGLARAILGQQVSVAAARTMADRLVRLVAIPAARLPSGDVIPLTRPRFAFPRPEAIADLGPARLRTIGLTRAKAAALHAAGVAVASGQLDFGVLRRAAPEDADLALRALPGVGGWTAAYVRLRALGDRDAFPATDLGVIRALQNLGVPRTRMLAAAERWRPWRGYATLHLWASLSAGEVGG
jgi:AraC family transcriptional regulator, regulatory protein of adaptative response / DNA-3-methyladenine glycosylase II